MKPTSPIKFRGAYTAIITPFTPDGSAIDMARLSEQIHFQAEGRVTGIVPCGTTGESPTLSDDEHRSIVETAVEIGQSLGLQVIAGAGSNNTAHAIELHRFAQSAGADASLQVTPYYNKPSQEGMYRHFSVIADSCDLPIMLYNIPGRSAAGLTIDTIERLAKHPNIQAIKEATGSLDMSSEIAARTDLALLSGDDSLTLPIASVGGVGVVSVVSNLVPDRVAALCEAVNDNRWDEARRIHFDLLPLSRGLLTLDTNPVPIKAALATLGRDSGALRLPLCRASNAAMEAIERLIHEHGLTPKPISV